MVGREQEDTVDLGLAGKAAIVTGGSRGIGRAIATEFAREGMNVLIASRNAATLEASARAISETCGVRVETFAADLADPAQAAPCVEAAVAAFGSLDVLVNNAGATKRGDFFALADADWEAGYALKFHGAVRMSRAAWPHLEQRGGAIINIVGIGSKTPARDFTIGGSVNSALVNLTKALADLGRDRGVRVNAINPGHIATDRLQHRVESSIAETGEPREAVIAGMLKTLGIRRFGKPEEIAKLAAFLVSDQAQYIQGSILDIDGGATRGY